MNLLRWCLLLAVLPSAQSWSQSDSDHGRTVCLLNFERRTHPFSLAIQRAIQEEKTTVSNFFYKAEATPVDFLNCIEKGFDEMVIIAHTSLVLNNNGDKVKTKLSYFAPLTESEKEDFIEQQKIEAPRIKQNIELLLNQKVKNGECPLDTPVGELPKSCQDLYRAYIDEAQKIEHPERIDANGPIYKQADFLDSLFNKADSLLKYQAQSGRQKLKLIRFLSCDLDSARRSYPSLNQLLSTNSLIVDLAPQQDLMTLIKGERVSTYDPEWLKQSFENSPSYASAYMNLTTLGVYRFGEGLLDHGRYTIHVKGIAFGISSKWTVFSIKKRYLQGMATGQVLGFWVPHFDFSLALWGNFEVGLFPVPEFKGTSEINSIGTELGLASYVEITRNY